MVAAAGSLWASPWSATEIVRIDPATNQVVARIQPGGVGLAAGFGSIWAFDIFTDEVLRIDPGRIASRDRIRVGGLPTGIAVGHGSLWVANQLDSTVSRISPETGRTVARIQLDLGGIWPGADPRDVRRGLGRRRERERRRPNPTRDLDRRPPHPDPWRARDHGRARVGLGRRCGQRLARPDRERQGRSASPFRATARTGTGPSWPEGTALWLAVPGERRRVGRLGRREPSLRLPARHYLSAIAVAGDVWVADQTAERILRLETTGGVT